MRRPFPFAAAFVLACGGACTTFKGEDKEDEVPAGADAGPMAPDAGSADRQLVDDAEAPGCPGTPELQNVFEGPGLTGNGWSVVGNGSNLSLVPARGRSGQMLEARSPPTSKEVSLVTASLHPPMPAKGVCISMLASVAYDTTPLQPGTYASWTKIDLVPASGTKRYIGLGRNPNALFVNFINDTTDTQALKVSISVMDSWVLKVGDGKAVLMVGGREVASSPMTLNGGLESLNVSIGMDGTAAGNPKPGFTAHFDDLRVVLLK